MKVYLVGGVVRDRLLGIPVQDRDWVVTGATPAQMKALGYRPVGKDFPVFLHPASGEEYALARTERKAGRGYKGFVVNADTAVTLEEDLRRRDLTINAMAEDETGALIDPFDGRADLQAGLLRHVSPAFIEDPLRVLRVARFAARFNFQVTPETLRLMREMSASGELSDLTPERVWQEMERACGAAHPRRFIEVLRESGALAAIFPEIERLFGVPQRRDYHPEVDTGVHLLMALDAAARLTADPRIRFAVLTHDLGKGTTPPEILPSHHGHEQRSVDLLLDFCRRWRAPNDYRDLAAIVARHHGLAHRAQDLKPATVLRVLKDTDALRRPDRFEQFLTACEADYRGRLGLDQRPYPQAEYLRAALAAATAVEVQPLLEHGLSGTLLAAELDRLRLSAIAAARRDSGD